MLNDKMETSELVEEGVKLFANAEKGLKRATDSLIHIRKIYPLAYANGDIKGGVAIKSESKAVELAGRIAAIRQDLIDFHKEGTSLAQQANADIPAAFAELPETKSTVVTTFGGNR